MSTIGNAINRVSGQSKQIQDVKDAYNQAAPGGISKDEFMKIAGELNDVWKLNRPELRQWIEARDPQLWEALRYGQASMNAEVGWSHYAPDKF